ncbi:MAG: SIR2 family protein [Treponema sp.]|uniref:SIR2 family NAD-dependent protein deacylase n=1 Tax=Treponema sp. TaxID=166 RepID=UPI002A9110B2|nr:SIR2 family protein [Treponema sp.]MDY6397878.1 SIR2 family protein [Treponema sp.]
MSIDVLPEEKVYLDEISERLFTNHAAVMVGAGFSKNAIPNSAICKKFSDWNELGNVFYEKLYGKDAKLPKKEYLNVLKLAEEVEAAFGRPALDNILQDCIPDLEYEPSELHKKLLNLPWTDVFTTNYDTLLERATKYNFNKKYTVVLSKEDLVYASKPRIIKLHGSFPASRPFTITEEDYRVYPKINAPFVNTVQQSLLENTLCLIGFSGDDPNFFQWLGWLRDNLESKISKIYLIGSFDLSITQKRLLEKRNIILVNLANSHYEALNLFVEYLSEKSKVNNINLWPYNSVYRFFPKNSPEPIERKIEKISSVWENQRLTYPGWIILPEEKRNVFVETTIEWLGILKNKNNIDYKLKFDFVFELSWRLEKSLYPMDKETADLIICILDDDFNSEKKNLLRLYLLRYYRQNGFINEWNELYIKLNNVADISINIKGELDYEQGLQALFNLDYPKLKSITDEWEYPKSTPFENAKKAGILAEIGELDKAISILKNALIDIREQQLAITSPTDCSLLSRESYILDLYQSFIFASHNYKDLDKKNEEYKDRVSILKTYLCNPSREESHFKDLLSAPYTNEVEIEIHDKYDIGEFVITKHFGKSYNEQKKAFSFLIYSESIGMPFCLHNKGSTYNLAENEAKSAIVRISDYNLLWAVSVCCRIADEKIVDELFTRQAINNFSVEYINNLCEALISTLTENEKAIVEENSSDTKNFAQVLAIILPEIISRLCSKCTTENKSKILSLINSILSSKYRWNYKGIDILIKRFMSSLLPNELEQFFLQILQLPIPDDMSPLEEMNLKSPFESLNINKLTFTSKIHLEESLVTPYLLAIKSEKAYIRRWGIITLLELFDSNLLNQREKEEFSEILWYKTDKFGLPSNFDLLKTGFINLPYPSNIKPIKLIKAWINSITLPDFKIQKGYSSQNVYYVCNLFSEIHNLLVDNVLEEKEINLIIGKLLVFWKRNKDVLQLKDIEEVFITCFYKMQRLLVNLLEALPVSWDTKEINELINQLNQFGISCIYLQNINNSLSLNDLHKRLELGVFDRNRNKRIDALFTLESNCETENEEQINKLASVLLFSILYEENELIIHNIDILGEIIRKHKSLAITFKIEILNVLSHLAEITDYKNEKIKLTFNEKLIIRQRTMRLAFVVYQLIGNKEPEIKYWEDNSNNISEFSDIRNKWM